MKRQRELSKQQEQRRKGERRSERAARKKEAKQNARDSGLARLADAPLGPVDRLGFPSW